MLWMQGETIMDWVPSTVPKVRQSISNYGEPAMRGTQVLLEVEGVLILPDRHLFCTLRACQNDPEDVPKAEVDLRERAGGIPPPIPI